jgi:tripartite-type tricarboxylate transporter receptor subunit TctC
MAVLVNARPASRLAPVVRPLREVRAAKSLDYGSAGNGTIVQMAVELFKRRAGIDLVHIPYKGSAPELTALPGR